MAIYETGVVAINHNFEVMWNFSGDIISDYQIVGNLLNIDFYDGGTINLSLTDGTRQKHKYNLVRVLRRDEGDGGYYHVTCDINLYFHSQKI